MSIVSDPFVIDSFAKGFVRAARCDHVGAVNFLLEKASALFIMFMRITCLYITNVDL